MSAYTPGPWGAAKASRAIGGGWGVVIGTFSSGIRVLELGDKEADAHLIASAPELLEALEALATFVEWHAERGHLPVHMNTPNTGALMQARAAIAKARGEAAP